MGKPEGEQRHVVGGPGEGCGDGYRSTFGRRLQAREGREIAVVDKIECLEGRSKVRALKRRD